MMILFIGVIIALWIMGDFEGEHTAAVMFSLFGALVLMNELSERKEKRKAGKKRAARR